MKAVPKIPTQRFSLARMIYTPAFAWAAYIAALLVFLWRVSEVFA